LGIDFSGPPEDELEINIFGPGYGECCLIHFGGGGWIVIDSCVNTDDDRPAALTYLDRIGVNSAEHVRLIIVSHWHDDHIRGLSSLLKACTAARFCASSALNSAEFVAVLTAY
jgi:glyoxylase-like metal-dependent hydrolase (beta-lactamase superfamily II)